MRIESQIIKEFGGHLIFWSQSLSFQAKNWFLNVDPLVQEGS